ncbi:MAG TPA: hypothetical protein VGV06_12010 [Methylomirabilota bacterium]|nr:hypothetical protein [Methylomirabilota bacterium]
MSPALARRLNAVFVLAVANALTTFLMCGLGACPDNPTTYLRLR